MGNSYGRVGGSERSVRDDKHANAHTKGSHNQLEGRMELNFNFGFKQKTNKKIFTR